MAIKVTVGEQKPQENSNFPKLMISINGRIVYFIEHGQGLQLNETNHGDAEDYPHYTNYWDMELFFDYNEPITLQNEA